MADSEGFQKVSYKGHKRKTIKSKLAGNKNICMSLKNTSLVSHSQRESFIRRILDAKVELSKTDLHDSIVASLREGLCALKTERICEIVSFGLGQISECVTSRYQFALLLCLQDFLNVKIIAYDPIFTELDIELLNHFEVTVLKENTEGKYKVSSKEPVLFFLPHCPKQLTNNLLWDNWGLYLQSCIIIANSFTTIVESNSSRILKESAEYILKILPHVLELPLINSFKFSEIFNDLAIHFFPNLEFVCQDLWDTAPEPKYVKSDIEFITKNSDNSLI
ncbi:unnamed protein product [Phaedon cochleariae]|uniref:SRR1-like domain-containing protein n=1 Tax=Phaedon cochleariae TaxID=80249 RepID=A0A9P0GIR6_PHACE|nr:unnamed protein product [Phaedon cochleariae]